VAAGAASRRVMAKEQAAVMILARTIDFVLILVDLTTKLSDPAHGDATIANHDAPAGFAAAR
jgi:hypothetical protein